MEILKIHATNITKHGEIDYEVRRPACWRARLPERCSLRGLSVKGTLPVDRLGLLWGLLPLTSWVRLRAHPLVLRGDVPPEPPARCSPCVQSVIKLGDGFNGADLRNICTEAGMFAIRDERDYVVQEDFMKVRTAVR